MQNICNGEFPVLFISDAHRFEFTVIFYYNVNNIVTVTSMLIVHKDRSQIT